MNQWSKVSLIPEFLLSPQFMKIFAAFVLLCSDQLTFSAELISYQSEAPVAEVTLRKSIAGPVTASIFSTVVIDPEPNSFEPGEIYLKIDDANGSWWVHTRYDSMNVVQFVGTKYLLITISSPASITTAVLNLEDKSLLRIGSGAGEILPSSSEDPLIHLTGRKGYSNGAYWYSSINDIQGRVIEFESIGESCLPISEILLSSNDDTGRLKQPLDYCVGVVR